MSKQYIPRIEAESVLRSSNGKFFSATFVKRTDGTLRHMTCRLGVRKGVTGQGMGYDPSIHGLIPVFEPEKDDFRMIDLNTLVEANINGTQYLFHD